ncbi:DUF3817 domain-containing protein [Nocardiopsis composta]|uniref:Integral membrane protein n=1 Tax=Nocardiopsis composta TaxID=157465 RepID=A0A7W8QRU8_9ACTN|nr:DUF3817 domain-containing protein [Nocardiopsis composta]MBB5434954.1 integral membrane protein [Nocardiopsis composta]
MSSSAPAAPRQRTEPVLTAFRIIAAAEAVTWVGLLIGMFFKRVVAWSELGVQIFGPLHGIAFIVYVVVAAIAWYRLRWGLWTGVIALAASVPPLGTVLFERMASARGLLDAPAPAGEERSAPVGG